MTDAADTRQNTGQNETQRRQLADMINRATAPDTQVVYLADTNHFRMADIYGAFANRPFWDEMNKDGKHNVLGVELFPPSSQPLFDAYYQHKITREEFAAAIDPSATSGQVSAHTMRDVMQGLMDAMDEGTRVVGLNNEQAAGGAHMIKSATLSTDLILHSIYWFRQQKDAYEKDPNGLARDVVRQGDARLAGMSEEQKSMYLDSKAAVLKKIEAGGQADMSDVLRLHEYMSPQYKQIEEEFDKAGPVEFDLSKRTLRDDQVVDTIDQYARAPDTRIFVLYGAGHLGGPHGMIQQLQAKGLKTNLVVPLLGKDEYKCLRLDNDVCRDLQENPQEAWDIVGNILKSLDYLEIPDIKKPGRVFTVKAPEGGVLEKTMRVAKGRHRHLARIPDHLPKPSKHQGCSLPYRATVLKPWISGIEHYNANALCMMSAGMFPLVSMAVLSAPFAYGVRCSRICCAAGERMEPRCCTMTA